MIYGNLEPKISFSCLNICLHFSDPNSRVLDCFNSWLHSFDLQILVIFYPFSLVLSYDDQYYIPSFDWFGADFSYLMTVIFRNFEDLLVNVFNLALLKWCFCYPCFNWSWWRHHNSDNRASLLRVIFILGIQK